ncbi:Orf52 protein [Salmonella enterica subsp. enterica serovar Inverness str. R8-3668]|uniref:Orf52 protein n=1 Tax=Salmonella enterica subsp. enterica serovar Inverness str. R8-3668 TaxID=913075 RepID=G5NMJ0_SALET|nr:Orf52 protein [Salmonella enterica subsp. enterica serovar Inverness str. R8-3668]
MHAPVKEIMTDLLKYNLSSDEALLVLCITREDIRLLTSEWCLSDEDITCVMQRLDVTYDQGADVSMIRRITEELMDDRRALRDVSVPASALQKIMTCALQKIMLLAGSEMQRLYAVAEDGGGDADAFLAEELDAMRQLQTAIDA